MRSVLSLLVGAAFVTATAVAGAQDLSGSVPSSGASPTVTGGSVTDTTGPTDHSVVTGRLALRYFGGVSMPSLSAMGMPGGSGNTLQTVGARYWLSGMLALEGGIALGVSSGSNEQTIQSGGNTRSTTSDDPNFFGVGLHLGVPIALAESKHLTISATPYFSLHYGRSAITTGMGDGTTDNTLSALRITVGANAQAELQFGFLGIPQLGLIAQFGLGMSYTSGVYEAVVRRNSDTTRISSSDFALGTTLGPNYSLSDIITGSVSAVYYFGNAPGR